MFSHLLPVPSLIEGNVGQRQYMRHQGLVDVEPLSAGSLVLDPLLQGVQALLQLLTNLLRDKNLFLGQTFCYLFDVRTGGMRKEGNNEKVFPLARTTSKFIYEVIL